jgi:hypothetical protein
MSRLMSARSPAMRLLMVGAVIGLSAGAARAAQAGSLPDFSSSGVAWIATSQDYISLPGGPSPTTNDPKHPFVPNGRGAQPTYRVADLTNPNLKDWATAEMKKANDDVLAGKIGYTARSSCMPAGVPDFMAFIVEPVYFIQSPKEVLMVYAGNQEVRRVYMDAPHARNPKPSWYGDAVGHYEGDTLVIDTVGMNAKTYVDNYRTPHTEKLHVVEHWKLIDGGKTLEVNFTADDPDTFNRPWSAIQRYRRVQQGPLDEQVCAENNTALFDYHIPQAEKPDF